MTNTSMGPDPSSEEFDGGVQRHLRVAVTYVVPALVVIYLPGLIAHFAEGFADRASWWSQRGYLAVLPLALSAMAIHLYVRR